MRKKLLECEQSKEHFFSAEQSFRRRSLDLSREEIRGELNDAGDKPENYAIRNPIQVRSDEKNVSNNGRMCCVAEMDMYIFFMIYVLRL